jgi:hypothetical protein
MSTGPQGHLGSKAGKAHPAMSRTTERVGAIVLIR